MENNELLNFELLHRHIIGDIEKGTDEKIKEYGKYFFQNEAYRLFKKVDAIHVKTENGQKPVSNSVLAVTGERGSGKTSFLKTIEKELNKQKGYYTFPVIDPSSLHGDLNILEIVCTHIDIIIEEKRQKGHHSDTTLAEYRKIKNDLSKIILAADTDYKQSDNGLQRLDENRKKVQFDENFTKLLISFLQLINQDDQINNKKEKCILLIDDLDLVEDKVIYELTEHIRKYFNGQMIVILTYKEEQLNDVLLKDKMIKEKDLKEYTDKEKLKDQCQKYTEKLIPYEHRVRLKNHKDFYGMNAEACFQEMIRPMLEEGTFEWEIYKPKFFPGNIVNENDTLKQWFEKMTFYKSKVNIKAFDKLEQVDAFANNLRGIIQWIETIYNMEALNQEKIDSGDKNEWGKLIENVELIRTRVIRTTFDFLSEDNRQFLERWLNTLVEIKLYQAYYYLGNNLIKSINNYGFNYLNLDIVDYRQVKPRNVSLADLIKIIDLYKLHFPKDGLFIYVFKILFSCELIEKYAQCYIFNEKREDYFELTRRDIIPNTKSIFSTNQKHTNVVNNFQIQVSAKDLDLDVDGEKIFNKIGISNYAINALYTKLRPKYTNSKSIYDKELENHFGQNVFSDESSIQSTSIYVFHPLTILGTDNYLRKAQNNRTYVLVSLFDIDCFLEQCKYHSYKEELEDTFSRLNEEISGENSIFLTTRIFTQGNHGIPVFSDLLIDFIKNYAKEMEKIFIDKPYKQSLIKALSFLEKEFKEDPASLDEILVLNNDIQNRANIRLDSKMWREKITQIFEKSTKYKLVLPNEK